MSASTHFRTFRRALALPEADLRSFPFNCHFQAFRRWPARNRPATSFRLRQRASELTPNFTAWRRRHPYPRCVRMTGTTHADRFNLNRFVSAQEATYARALTELTRGVKTSHWMWFIFPQVAGLGSSEMSRRYAIGSIDEAQAYLAHRLLGARYRECVAVLQDLVGTTAEAVFGSVDAAKLRSSLTLFAEAAPGDPLFAAALQRWFRGDRDKRTVDTISAGLAVNG